MQPIVNITTFFVFFSRFVCDCVPELKFNVEAIDLLIRSHLINMREFDQHIVQVWWTVVSGSAV